MWILLAPLLFYSGWNEVYQAMNRRTEVAPAVDLKRLLNGPASTGGRKIWRRREPGGGVCLRRSCFTSSSTCLCWIGRTLLRYPCNNEPSVTTQEAVLVLLLFNDVFSLRHFMISSQLTQKTLQWSMCVMFVWRVRCNTCFVNSSVCFS